MPCIGLDPAVAGKTSIFVCQEELAGLVSIQFNCPLLIREAVSRHDPAPLTVKLCCINPCGDGYVLRDIEYRCRWKGNVVITAVKRQRFPNFPVIGPA